MMEIPAVCSAGGLIVVVSITSAAEVVVMSEGRVRAAAKIFSLEKS